MAPLLFFLLFFPSVFANSKEIVPRAELVLGERVPDIAIKDQYGRVVRLSSMSEGRVLLLSFIYTKCSSACPLIVKSIKESLSKVSYKKFQVVLIDFDLRDGLEDVERFAKNNNVKDWAVGLVEANDLDRLTKAVDFRFFYDEKTDMFAHPNVLIILTPDLRISSYILGVKYDPKKLDRMIYAALNGEINVSPIRSLLLKCFRYDPVTGSYYIDWSFVAMLVGGALPIFGMAYYLFIKDLYGLVRRAV